MVLTDNPPHIRPNILSRQQDPLPIGYSIDSTLSRTRRPKDDLKLGSVWGDESGLEWVIGPHSNQKSSFA